MQHPFGPRYQVVPQAQGVVALRYPEELLLVLRWVLAAILGDRPFHDVDRLGYGPPVLISGGFHVFEHDV